MMIERGLKVAPGSTTQIAVAASYVSVEARLVPAGCAVLKETVSLRRDAMLAYDDL